MLCVLLYSSSSTYVYTGIQLVAYLLYFQLWRFIAPTSLTSPSSPRVLIHLWQHFPGPFTKIPWLHDLYELYAPFVCGTITMWSHSTKDYYYTYCCWYLRAKLMYYHTYCYYCCCCCILASPAHPPLMMQLSHTLRWAATTLPHRSIANGSFRLLIVSRRPPANTAVPTCCCSRCRHFW